ncbi:hypothetical protein GCM10027519_16190 [Kineococcus endophyticus]
MSSGRFGQCGWQSARVGGSGESAPERTYVRRTARVVVLDADDRVLLLRVLRQPHHPAAGVVWYTPGGGVEAGENVRQAAVRELREETGLSCDAEDLRHVATTSGHAEAHWISGLVRDDYYLLRVHRPPVDTSGQTAAEKDSHDGFRWWHLEDLVRSADPVHPPSLPDLIGRLVARQVPDHVVQLPWVW